ncbi:MAG TPA: MoaD/ThiS family protein [Thermoanaerobaculia bacterium]|nr:MoaD/ThiS family protein [Thermoanaerobaculia bacterium]
MRVNILHFASFREAAGQDEERRELPEGTRVSDLWLTLRGEIPLFGRYPAMPPAAVNREYAGPETILHDGDEVAFLPPVAGG